jgi:hypothetical protein
LKTQIITLESHDDLISVRDKLSWAKTPRILLVWPKFETVALRLLDLKVLQRHAESLGAHLGLVTRRANIRRDAQSLGIPVFDSTATAQKDQWPHSEPRSRRIPNAPRRDLRKVRDIVYEKEPAWRSSLPGRVITFTVGVTAVLVMAGLFVPRAAVTLYPESSVQSAVIPVSASESVESVSVTGSIPARKISIVVSAEQSLAIVSEIAVPNSKAQGIARFSNLSQGEVNIPAGAMISTTGDHPVRFITLHETLLPAGVDEFVDVPIEALHPGASGNMPAKSVVVVEGPLGLSVSVINPNLISGGTDSKLIGATEDDRGRLREVVMDNMRRDAESKLRAQISSADMLLQDTFEVSQAGEETFDPAPGQPGKTLNLKMKAEYSARFISGEDLKQLSTATLDLSIAQGFEAFDAVVFKPGTDPATDSLGVTHFDLDVTRTSLRKMDEVQVFSIVRGRKPDLIKDALTIHLSLRKDPDIVLNPSWWPWMPLIPFNISIYIR